MKKEKMKRDKEIKRGIRKRNRKKVKKKLLYYQIK